MEHDVINKFNRGEVDIRAMARDDYRFAVNACEHMENFMPTRLGPMSLRPGFQYLGETAGACYIAEFTAATDDVAVLEFSDELLRVWVDDALITRTAVTSTITNGTFDANITSWTTPAQVGDQAAVWLTGGYMSLIGNGSVPASAYQTLTGVTETGAEHAMRIVIAEAPVIVSIGTSGAKSFDIFKGELGPGTHSLVFTPASDITITVENHAKYRALVDSIAFEAAGTFSLPVSVPEASLRTIRYRQSADVLFVAWGAGAMFQIERRGVKSWSVADYRFVNGPWRKINDTSMTMAPGALTGTTTLTASADFFTADHVGALFRLAASTQEATADVTAHDNGTAGVRVTGVENGRNYFIKIDYGATGAGTVTLQRSDDNSSWTDITQYTTNTTDTLNDGFDNVIYYYRLWVKVGDFTAATISLTISTSSAAVDDGVCRVISYTSSTVVGVQVIKELLSTDATKDWYESEWSAYRGYPTSVGLHEGRLSWAGRTKVWLSVSDDYTNFDADVEGDSAAITRTIGYGPVDCVEWLAETTRLLMGVASNVISVRTNAFGEILTPTNANLKSATTQGVASIPPTLVDERVYYAHRNGTRLMEIDGSQPTLQTMDKTILAEDICEDGIRRIAVQMVPETRVFVVLDSGQMRVLTVEPLEEVTAWSRITTDGTIEDVVVTPGEDEDRVYIVVSRTNGRYLEKMAKYSEAEPSDTERTLDSFLVATGDGTTTITGTGNLSGSTVRTRYRNGSGGTFTAGTTVTTDVATPTGEEVIVGIPYTANYTSAKLSAYTNASVLSKLKRIVSSALIMSAYRDRSITVGYEAGQGDMPLIEDGKQVSSGAVVSGYDEIPFEFDGDTDTDPRFYIQATAGCTILATVLRIEAEDGAAKQNAWRGMAET